MTDHCRIRFVRVPRFSRTMVLLLAAFVIWVVMVLSVHLYNMSASSDNSQQLVLCPMRLTTGIPCPTCGGTRAAVGIATLRFQDAWTSNPLLAVGIPLICLLFFIRIAFGRIVQVQGSPNSKRFFWVFFILIVLSNWVWVIFSLH